MWSRTKTWWEKAVKKTWYFPLTNLRKYQEHWGKHVWVFIRTERKERKWKALIVDICGCSVQQALNQYIPTFLLCHCSCRNWTNHIQSISLLYWAGETLISTVPLVTLTDAASLQELGKNKSSLIKLIIYKVVVLQGKKRTHILTYVYNKSYQIVQPSASCCRTSGLL